MITFLRKNKSTIEVVLAIIVVYAILFATGIGCPIKYLTGISCAGCGMTRAMLSAVRLDFQGAFYYHPLFFLMVPTAIALVFKEKIPKKIFRVGLIILCILFVLVYLIRLFDMEDLIVVFEPRNGLIGRLLIKD